MSIEAMRLALEALEYLPEMQGVEEAITALRLAIEQAENIKHECVACEGSPQGDNNPCVVCGLAQPKQEPVAWINWNAATGERTISFVQESELASEPLYTSPPPRQPLTEDEIQRLWEQAGGWYAMVRAIERHHGIKEK
jgi:hypothetical protein